MMKTSPAVPNRSLHVLVVEDNERTQKALVFLLHRHGYTATVARDGQVALGILKQPDPPSIVLLDWEMPRLDGLHVCRAVRSMPRQRYIYVIMITAHDDPADLVAALDAGADDFLSKPTDNAQLLARMRSGERVLALEARLAERIAELEKTLEEVSKLKRLLPICSYCKKIRDDGDYWKEIETYLHDHTGADFSHGVCPECMKTVVEQELSPEAKARRARQNG